MQYRKKFSWRFDRKIEMRPELSDLTYNIQPMERSPYKAYSGEYKPYIWDAIGAMNERDSKDDLFLRIFGNFSVRISKYLIL